MKMGAYRIFVLTTVLSGPFLFLEFKHRHVFLFPSSLLCFFFFSSDDPVTVTVINPSWDYMKWSEYPNLSNIELLFRRVGDVEWLSALDPSGNRIYPAKSPPEVLDFALISLYAFL